MASPTYYVFDGDSGASVNPYRPSLDDVGGAAKEDDQSFPPDPVTMPTAADWNQMARLIAAYGAVCPIFRALVSVGVGTRGIAQLMTVSGNVTDSSITVTSTGTGITEIEWTAGDIPQPVGAHVTPAEATSVSARYAFSSATKLVVATYDDSGALADTNFFISVF